jgi:hypothetical protein
MSTLRRLARLTHVTCPDTGKVYPIPAGGSDDDPPPAGDGSADPPADPAATASATPLEQQALDAINALKDAGTEIPEALQAVVKEFRDARKEAGNHRTAKSAEKERADLAERKLGEVLNLLGVETDGDPDPEALKAAVAERDSKLTERDAALTAKTVEFDAYRTAKTVTVDKIAPAGVNPDALLDSASFLKAAAGLDPNADSYKADLASAIKTAVETNPLLAASPGGGRGPGLAQGVRPSAPTNQQSRTLEEAYGAHYNGG